MSDGVKAGARARRRCARGRLANFPPPFRRRRPSLSDEPEVPASVDPGTPGRLAPASTDGRFILEDGEELFAGVRTTALATKDDVKCAITWSGFRPATTPLTLKPGF